jgi:hypothetical protein
MDVAPIGVAALTKLAGLVLIGVNANVRVSERVVVVAAMSAMNIYGLL